MVEAGGEWLRSWWQLRQLGLTELEIGYWARIGDALGVLPHEAVCRVAGGVAVRRVQESVVAAVGGLRLSVDRLQMDVEGQGCDLLLPLLVIG